jgi:hypothetical protein
MQEARYCRPPSRSTGASVLGGCSTPTAALPAVPARAGGAAQCNWAQLLCACSCLAAGLRWTVLSEARRRCEKRAGPSTPDLPGKHRGCAVDGSCASVRCSRAGLLQPHSGSHRPASWELRPRWANRAAELRCQQAAPNAPCDRGCCSASTLGKAPGTREVKSPAGRICGLVTAQWLVRAA